MPSFVANRFARTQRASSFAPTVKVVEAICTLPALSVATALKVLSPSAKLYAGPLAPGHVVCAGSSSDRESAAVHVMATVWSTV